MSLFLCDDAVWQSCVSMLLRRLPPLAGRPILLQRTRGLHDRRGPVHAGAFLRDRRIAFDCTVAEFPRIFVHELFHFVWLRAGNIIEWGIYFVTRLTLSAAIATALLMGCMTVGCSNAPTSVSAASVKAAKDRRVAPDFTLKDADGKNVRLSDYKGKVVLLDFWATWCGPCKIEIPWFIELQRNNRDRGFEVLGIAMDDEGWEIVKPFAARMQMNYRLVMGSEGVSQLYGGIEALPTTFMIDREGKIAAVHVGLTSKKDFVNGIEELLRDGDVSASNRTGVPANTGAVAK
jgi:peroxiredoxin